MRGAIRGLAAVLVLAGAGLADDKKADGPTAVPKGTPLELTVTGKKTTYTLDRGGLTAAEYAKKLADAKKKGKMPAPPAVELEVVVKNTSDQPVTVWVKGDPVVLALTLKGPGAENVEPSLAFTLEFRAPEGVELAPGKTHTFPVKALKSGHRGGSKFAYWTAAGEYELVATLTTGMTPAPKDAKDAGDGFGQVTLTSAPLKLKVEDKE